MVSSQNPDKRGRLVQAAMALAYRQGFAETSIADIATEANVPLGNVYYYFKTKEDIGAAIIEERLAQIRKLHQKFDELDSPKERLCAFVEMTFNNRKILARGGCPIGSFCTELHKENGPLAKQSAVLLAEILAWLQVQFEALDRSSDSRGLAVHLLSALQGVSVVTHTLGEPEIVLAETNRLQQWIRALKTKSAGEDLACWRS